MDIKITELGIERAEYEIAILAAREAVLTAKAEEMLAQARYTNTQTKFAIENQKLVIDAHSREDFFCGIAAYVFIVLAIWLSFYIAQWLVASTWVKPTPDQIIYTQEFILR